MPLCWKERPCPLGWSQRACPTGWRRLLLPKPMPAERWRALLDFIVMTEELAKRQTIPPTEYTRYRLLSHSDLIISADVYVRLDMAISLTAGARSIETNASDDDLIHFQMKYL